MKTVKKEFYDHIAILRLNRDPTNAINSQVVDELSASLTEIKGSARGLGLCGGDDFFSIGFDLPELLKLDRAGMADFFNRFNQLCVKLYTIPIPSICALSGHAVAGGNILALTCDYRYSSSQEKKIGLNELKLGLPVPYLADMMLRQAVGNRYASQVMYGGEFMTFPDAKIIGMIDALVSPGELEDFTLRRLSQIAAYNQKAFSAVKANKVQEVIRRYEANFASKNDEFLDCWFSDPVQHELLEASKKF